MKTVIFQDFEPITTDSRETGQDVAHDRLALSYTVSEPGYMYIYLSNENATAVEVYFDDFKVDHVKSPIVQVDDYYPFGLTFNSYKRENSTPNDYKYNSKEEQTELELGWLDYGARMYQPEIGRWGAADKMSELTYHESPYSYANNPINMVDIGGHFRISADFARRYPTLARMVRYYLPMLKHNQHVKGIFMRHTGFTSAQFDEMVEYGKGPWIYITDPDKGNWETQNENKTIYSLYNTYDEDNIYLVDEIEGIAGDLTDLENMMKAAVAGNENGDDLGAQMFFISLKIFHEAAHRAIYFQQGKVRRNNREYVEDQGSVWERLTYKQFSYKSDSGQKMNKAEVYDYYYSNYNSSTMTGMTPTDSHRKRRKPDADEEACKRSGGCK